MRAVPGYTVPLMLLEELGWNDWFASAFVPHAAPGCAPGRVTADFGRGWGVTTADGEILTEATGKLRHRSTCRAELPVAGDWVVVQPRANEPRAQLLAVLPRRTVLSRQAAGHRRAEEQVLAANLDTVFIVIGLDAAINLRRLERFLTAVRSGGIAAVVVLNKSDLLNDPAAACAEVTAHAGGATVVVTSATLRGGIKPLKPWLVARQTVAFLGTSGVGKSALVNRLVGDDVQAVQAVRAADCKGRHTTSSRELLIGPGGVLLLDTPGMREFQFWDTDAPLAGLFPDVAAQAAQCRFRDCRHGTEPGCAVQAAIARGELDAARLASFLKLKAERSLASTPWKRA